MEPRGWPGREHLAEEASRQSEPDESSRYVYPVGSSKRLDEPECDAEIHIAIEMIPIGREVSAQLGRIRVQQLVEGIDLPEKHSTRRLL